MTFTCIHWDGLNEALESKGDPFRLRLSRQVNGACGTQAMVSLWDKTRDNLCPDCGTEETAAHLMVCPGHSRTLLLKQEVEDLERWMRNNNTDSAIAFWIPKYILLRNTRALSSFPNLPEKLKLFAAEWYAIGWR